MMTNDYAVKCIGVSTTKSPKIFIHRSPQIKEHEPFVLKST